MNRTCRIEPRRIAGAQVVEHAHGVAGARQPVGQRRAQKASAAGDEESHNGSLK